MLDATFVHQLRDSSSFTVWPSAVEIPVPTPTDILDLIGPANDMAQLRTVRPRNIQPSRPAEALAAWEAGATIQVRMVHLLWPHALEIADAVAEASRQSHNGVSIFWSRGGVQGAAPHHDAPDVVVVHLEGVKRWRALTPGGEHETGAYNLRRGDAMMVRSGSWHVCEPLTDCVHLAIRLDAVSAR